MTEIINRTQQFIQAQAVHQPGEYTFCIGGQVSLYASCYAAMALHYVGGFQFVDGQERQAWCAYINSWQDPETGYYLGPELAPGQFTRADMDVTYARMHLAIHVLPALEVLGGAPAHPLTFARVFANPDFLIAWLHRRDWRQAWLEGNNLLFAGQLLVHLRDKEGYAPAADALDIYFDWLDQQQDPATGLWGTNGFCDPYAALYGGYHQLLVYYACGRPVRHAERIIDTVLALQQPDGSFTATPGGGACEDVDAVDVLVNLVKRTAYRVEDVRQALANAIPHILRQQAPDGGFVYRWGRSFMQSGVLRTFVPMNQPDIFSTWFRLHTLALINEVVENPVLMAVPWQFNLSCSMGWHDRSVQIERSPAKATSIDVSASNNVPARQRLARQGYNLLKHLPNKPTMRLFRATLPRYLRALPAEQGLDALLEIEQSLDHLGREKSYELGSGLEVQHWWSQAHQYYLSQVAGRRHVVHLGCGDGSLSFTLASQSQAAILATDGNSGHLVAARSQFQHPRLSFVEPSDLREHLAQPDMIVLTDLAEGKPAWKGWQQQWRDWPKSEVLAQITEFPRRWQDLSPAKTADPLIVTSAESIERLIPEGWRVLEVFSVYGASHARLLTPRLK